MPNAERIAELQRVAFGAGASDDERRAAAHELEALRAGGGTVDRGTGSGTGTAAASAARAGTAASPGAIVDPIDRADASHDSDPFGFGAHDGDGAADATRPVPSAVTRWAVLVGAIALAIGFGAGWAGASIAATELLAEARESEPAPAPVDDDLVFPLAVEPVGVAVPIDETPAVDVFDRAAAEGDLVDLGFFGDASIEPASPRLLATRSDGIAVWAARTVDGELCLLMRIDEFSGASTCTADGMLPPEGIGVETFIQARGFYAVRLEQSGDLRIRAEGVGAGPGSGAGS